MRILNWNIRGLFKNWAELQCLAVEYDVIALSETMLTAKKDNIVLKDFNCIRIDRGDGKSDNGGMVVFIRKNLQYLTFNLNFTPRGMECIACKIYRENNSVNLVSIYFPSNFVCSDLDFNKFCMSLGHLNNLILTGDFNAHHGSWSLKTPDQRGKVISNVIDNFDLNIVNTQNSYTRTYMDNQIIKYSSPDITFASSDIYLKLKWNVMDNRGSDHLPISIEIENANLKFERSYRKISLGKVDWLKFREGVSNNFVFDAPINADNIIAVYKEFIDCIYDSLRSAGGVLPDDGVLNERKIRKEPPGVIWWNKECSKVVEERRKALSNYKKDASILNFDIYMEKVNLAKKVLRKEKEKGFRSFCDSLNPNTPYELICKSVKNLKRRFLGNKDFSVPKFQIINDVELNKCFEKISKNYNYDNLDLSSDYSYVEGSVLDMEINPIEVEIAIKNSKNRSAPGRDLISYFILKQLPCECYKWLARLYGFLLESGTFVDSWNDYNVCFISKGPNKGYRPIALANTLLKIFERIMNDRLQWFCENKGLIPRNFFGFRRGKSCYDCLSILRTDISLAKVKNKFLGLLSLDLQSAYDNVSLEKLLSILKSKGVPPKFIKFIYNLINNRNLFGYFGGVEIGNRSSNKGLPQGSILSPILFNIYISEIIFKINYNCKLLSFADDILIYSASSDSDQIISELTESANEVNDWLYDLKLNISFEKSRFMMFSYNSITFSNSTFSIHFNNIILNNCSFIRYLGVYIDAGLTWENHIQYLKEKVRKLLGMFNCICKFKYGAHPSTAISIYKQFIRPALDWGGFLLEDCCNRAIKKLDVIQNSALRTALGCIRTTPINVLHHLAGIATLSNRRICLSKKFLARQASFSDSLLIPKFKLLQEYILNRRKCPSYIFFFLYRCWADYNDTFHELEISSKCLTYSIPYSIQFLEKNVDTEIGKEIKRSKDPSESFSKYLNNNSRFVYHIYTDGSKNDDSCGCGVYMMNSVAISLKMNKYSSIFSAEAYAIYMALRKIKELNIDNVMICTDSLSVLSGIKSLGLKSNIYPIFGNILLLLNELILENAKNIKFVWIPSHVGLFGNEKADELAKKSLSNVTIHYVRVFYKEIYSLFNNQSLVDMQEYVVGYDFSRGLKGRKYVNNCDPFNLSVWFDKYDLDRKRIIIINRIKSGHVRTKDHLFRKNIVDSNYCVCNDIQSLEHLIWYCPEYDLYRESLCSFLRSKGILRGEDITIIFNKKSMDIILRIVFFILISRIIV